MLAPEVDGTKINVITEQGDLGLGVAPLNEADAKAYAEAPAQEEPASAPKRRRKAAAASEE